MSHKHFCDVAGHFWDCEGTALRPEAGDKEPSVCMCAYCNVPMEDGDHHMCGLELVPCLEHLHQWRPSANIANDGIPLFVPPDLEEKIEAAVSQFEHYEAACLWCGGGYDEFNPKSEDDHFAHNCPNAPEELKENAKRRLLLGGYDAPCCESKEEVGGGELR